MKIVTAAVISEDGKYLLCQRAVNDSQALLWEFPGGKLEPGETPEQCLIREIHEELCLDVQVTGYCGESRYRYAGGEILLKAYFATITGGELKLMVHRAMEWVEPYRLLDYDLSPADIKIAAGLNAIFGRV